MYTIFSNNHRIIESDFAQFSLSEPPQHPVHGCVIVIEFMFIPDTIDEILRGGRLWHSQVLPQQLVVIVFALFYYVL